MNYLCYPFKTMRITQGYLGVTSHLNHTKGDIKDYPIDEGCEDGGKSPIYCPCDEVVVKRISGVYNGYTNTYFIESTSKVVFADGTKDYMTMLITHSNDDDFKNMKTGTKYKRGELMTHEGTDGNASGNHLHFSVGKGKYLGKGWQCNNYNKWCLRTTNGSCKPENAFYIDKNFTKILNDCGYQWVTKPDYEITPGSSVSKGCLVTINEHATYYNGSKIPEWVKQLSWYVDTVSGGRAVLGEDKSRKYKIMSPIHTCYLTVKNLAKFNKGDLVYINKNATYYNGENIPSWVQKIVWFIDSISGDRAVLGCSKSGDYKIMSPINIKDISIRR